MEKNILSKNSTSYNKQLMEEFSFQKVDPCDRALMERIYRLRYDVYTQERKFLNEAWYPQGLESDEYDPQSVHFAATDSGGEVIGTVRLIMGGPRLTPIEKYCPDLFTNPHALIGEFAEISRFIINKRIRRDTQNRILKRLEGLKELSLRQLNFIRNTCIAYGLYHLMYQEGSMNGITHYFALMERSLALSLRLNGFKPECVGQEVDFLGKVRPYLFHALDIQETFLKYPAPVQHLSLSFPRGDFVLQNG